MKKKNGFIATSLIYSFFLVFIAVIAAILNSYIANKTILDRFNEDAEEGLNTKTYTVTIYSQNANIQDGITLSNLVSNGDFSNGLNFWTTVGSATYTTTPWLNNTAVSKNNSNVSGSYLSQNIHVLQNSKYYYSIEYSHNVDTILNTYLYDSSYGTISTSNNLARTWTKGSQIFTSPIDGNVVLTLGRSSFSYAGTSYFSHAIVLNLTASFGSGYEPDKTWIDNNIEYFDGTISYIQKTDINSGETVQIRFAPYTNYTRSTIKCTGDTAEPLAGQTMTMQTIDERIYGLFKISSVKSNIRCTVDWSI